MVVARGEEGCWEKEIERIKVGRRGKEKVKKVLSPVKKKVLEKISVVFDVSRS